MHTTIAIWVTVDTTGLSVLGGLDFAERTLSDAARALKGFDPSIVEMSLSDEATVYDENGDEVFNGEY